MRFHELIDDVLRLILRALDVCDVIAVGRQNRTCRLLAHERLRDAAYSYAVLHHAVYRRAPRPLRVEPLQTIESQHAGVTMVKLPDRMILQAEHEAIEYDHRQQRILDRYRTCLDDRCETQLTMWYYVPFARRCIYSDCFNFYVAADDARANLSRMTLIQDLCGGKSMSVTDDRLFAHCRHVGGNCPTLVSVDVETQLCVCVGRRATSRKYSNIQSLGRNYVARHEKNFLDPYTTVHLDPRCSDLVVGTFNLSGTVFPRSDGTSFHVVLESSGVYLCDTRMYGASAHTYVWSSEGFSGLGYTTRHVALLNDASLYMQGCIKNELNLSVLSLKDTDGCLNQTIPLPPWVDMDFDSGIVYTSATDNDNIEPTFSLYRLC
jgi:hypothetical protein